MGAFLIRKSRPRLPKVLTPEFVLTPSPMCRKGLVGVFRVRIIRTANLLLNNRGNLTFRFIKPILRVACHSNLKLDFPI